MYASELAPTPRDTILREGTAQLYHFRRPEGRAAKVATPLLIVPSLINRWYIVDLRKDASLVAAMNETFDTWCLDWGVPNDEDRFLTWDSVVSRIGRMVRAIKRRTGAEKVALMGYCIGGTLSSIYAALHPEEIAALINLAGPIDFSEGGLLSELVNEAWFDPSAIAAAGNVTPHMMQSGFTAIRPTTQISKWINLAANLDDSDFMLAFGTLEAWAADNVPFPGAAYETYISELYQQNKLIKGEHYVGGRRVDLGQIKCPILSVIASRDHICPGPAAIALNDHSGSKDKQVLELRGGHVGAVVGSRARTELYPGATQWLLDRFGPKSSVSKAKQELRPV